MKNKHAKSSIFLMEIILNILLFSVLVVIGLQFFMRTHSLTRQTSELHQAVTSCESVAAVFENGDGTLDALTESYHFSVDLDNRVLIYLDENFSECRKEEAHYYITVSLADVSTPALTKATLACCNRSGEMLYTLTACHYQQLRAQKNNQPEVHA